MNIKEQLKNKLKKKSESLKKKKEFLTLPQSKRNKILKSQAERLFEHYNEDKSWKELQAVDINAD